MSAIYGGSRLPLQPLSAIVRNLLTLPYPPVVDYQKMADPPSPEVSIWLITQPLLFCVCQHLARPLLQATVICLARRVLNKFYNKQS